MDNLFCLIGFRRAQMMKEDKRSYEYKQSHLTPDQMARTKDNRDKYSPVPQIPSDIGYRKSKDIGGAKQTGVFSNCMSNPAVPLGLGLTTLAVLGMIRRSVQGDKLGTQRYMQYRIMAQFFT
uniref:HIG1 domain-containing protein n=1 Tax=Panagrolaimus sp. JU765 TaxID=591449 RepID=A0AC34QIZ6_9BILA